MGRSPSSDEDGLEIGCSLAGVELLVGGATLSVVGRSGSCVGCSRDRRRLKMSVAEDNSDWEKDGRILVLSSAASLPASVIMAWPRGVRRTKAERLWSGLVKNSTRPSC